MSYRKYKHHILPLLLSFLLCSLFTGICFITTYNISSSCVFGLSPLHDSHLDPQVNINNIITYNDVTISETSFSLNGSDPFVVYAISDTSSLSDSSFLYTKITFKQTYSHDIHFSIYYSTTADAIFSETQRETLHLKQGMQTVYLALPDNLTYLRLDIDNIEESINDIFCITDINLIHISILDILYNFLVYTKYILILGNIFIILASLWVCKAEKIVYINRLLIICYITFILLFMGKTLIYARSIGQTPDEPAHIAYMVYETEHLTEFVPHFEYISYSYSIGTENGTYKSTNINGSYLGHPPLYYRLLSILGIAKIQEPGKTAYINIHYLYAINMLMVWIGILLFLYIGYTRIPHENIVIPLHILYAAICTGIPMVAYETVGCSNDNLLYIEFALFLLGVLRYFEKKRTIQTYLLVSIGMSSCLLTKLTGGCVMVIMIAVLFILDSIQTKSIRMIANKQFCMTMPIYMIPILYFAVLYNRYHTIQPSLQLINPDFYYQSSWYIVPEDRLAYSMAEYYHNYFIRSMSSSWSCFYNGNINLGKPFLSFWQWPFILIVLIAIAAGIYSLFFYCFKEKKVKYLFGIAASFSLMLTFFYNFYSAYKSHLNSGNLGGGQARYYMFALPAIAFLNLIIYQDILLSHASKKVKTAIITWIILLITWLIAADLPYTIIMFPTYFIN